jgi:predicted dehydrogenase
MVSEMKDRNVVRLAQIGLGAWSGATAEAVKRSKKTRLATCFDLIPERRKTFKERYGCDEEKSYEDVVCRDDIDGVLVTSPNFIHAEQAVLAAQHGKHVFVEKPIANTIEDGRKIIGACAKAGVVLMVGHYMRRWAGYRKLKELVDKGAIGKPVQVEANTSSSQGLSLTPGEFRWRGDDSGCPAGSLMTRGIHQADAFNYLFGPIKSVFAYFNRLYIKAPVEDVTGTVCQFESGMLGYLGSNFVCPRVNWMYIYGTEGNLVCTVIPTDLPFAQAMLQVHLIDGDTRVQLFEKGKSGARDIPISVGDPVLEEIDEFADCIRTGAKPETDGPAALTALSFIRAAIESARTGKPASLEH